jgi:hypothetical protein
LAKDLESNPIAFQDGNVQLENLPYPTVLYPGSYGAFFGFQEKGNSLITLCACAEEAIENYVRMRLSGPVLRNADPRREFILDKMYFPLNLVEELMISKAPANEQVLDHLLFKKELCHE